MWLQERIRERVHSMFETGLEDECRKLMALDLAPDAVTTGAIQAYLALRASERL